MFRENDRRGELTALLISVPVWLVCALLLTTIASLINNRAGLSLRDLGISSSVISFISACSAGCACIRVRKSKRLITGLICSGLLVILLLTCGYIISGRLPEQGAVISVTTFTLSGCLFGAVFCPTGIVFKRRIKKVDIKK